MVYVPQEEERASQRAAKSSEASGEECGLSEEPPTRRVESVPRDACYTQCVGAPPASSPRTRNDALEAIWVIAPAPAGFPTRNPSARKRKWRGRGTQYGLLQRADGGGGLGRTICHTHAAVHHVTGTQRRPANVDLHLACIVCAPKVPAHVERGGMNDAPCLRAALRASHSVSLVPLSNST